MTHECGSEPFWRVFEDLGGVSMVPWRGEHFLTEAMAAAFAEWLAPQRGHECRAVRSCLVNGHPAVCGGPDAVRPTNPAAKRAIAVGKPPIGGDE